ncbi:MAG TPA: (2Fe-2S)-binding protein [Acidimicrobiia bacterium]|nr:(2Fe-2S)-binding protein [Acidimicrobiia bacterium]
MNQISIEFELNGAPVSHDVYPNRLLLDVIRDDFGLTGAKRSCDVQVCGACTVLLDGKPVSACTTLAIEMDGRSVTTIEGVEPAPGELHPLQRAFAEAGALQCGFCTPGFILTSLELVDDGVVDREEIVERLDGNICRCTGYHKIIDAVATASAMASDRKEG